MRKRSGFDWPAAARRQVSRVRSFRCRFIKTDIPHWRVKRQWNQELGAFAWASLSGMWGIRGCGLRSTLP